MGEIIFILAAIIIVFWGESYNIGRLIGMRIARRAKNQIHPTSKPATIDLNQDDYIIS